MTGIEFTNEVGVTLVKSSAHDDDVAMAAWVSFDRDSEERLHDRAKVKGLIKFLLRERHMSPFEHSTFTFKIDCPIFVAREFHRHRTMAYNEVSGRYTEMKPRFYIPNADRPLIQEGKAGQYIFVAGDEQQSIDTSMAHMDAVMYAWSNYQMLLSQGIAKEVARMTLPLNLMTQFYATVNARNLMHFLDLRTSMQALYEIRAVADKMEDHLAEQMPYTWEAWNEARNI